MNQERIRYISPFVICLIAIFLLTFFCEIAFTAEETKDEKAEAATSAKEYEPASDEVVEQTGLELLTGKDTPLKKDMVIDFFGDSITWQGGYLNIMNTALGASKYTKELNIKLIKRGINGGKSTNLRDGCEDLYGCTQDPFAKVLETDKPAVAVIYIGINDVWHGKNGTTPEDFEKCINELLTQAKNAGVVPVVATLSIIGEIPDGSNEFDEKLDQYAEITRKVADENDATLVDLRKVFIDYLKEHKELVKKEDGSEVYERKGLLTYDGVHMTELGNELLADEISIGIFEALNK